MAREVPLGWGRSPFLSLVPSCGLPTPSLGHSQLCVVLTSVWPIQPFLSLPFLPLPWLWPWLAYAVVPAPSLDGLPCLFSLNSNATGQLLLIGLPNTFFSSSHTSFSTNLQITPPHLEDKD